MNRSALILTMSVLVLGGILLNRGIAQDAVPLTDPTVVDQAAASNPVSQADPVLEADEPEVVSGRRFNKWTALVGSVTIFVLAIFVGFEIITKVPPTLHTPLMSGSNAISGISIVGALLAASTGEGWFAAFLGFLALVLATTNVVGGYMVTHRMLSMFQSKR